MTEKNEKRIFTATEDPFKRIFMFFFSGFSRKIKKHNVKYHFLMKLKPLFLDKNRGFSLKN